MMSREDTSGFDLISGWDAISKKAKMTVAGAKMRAARGLLPVTIIAGRPLANPEMLNAFAEEREKQRMRAEQRIEKLDERRAVLEAVIEA